MLTLAAGDAQTGLLGAPLAAPLAVRVADSGGNPVAGAHVTFAVTAGGGSLGSPSALSDAQGLAATTLTLGAVAGVNTVEASLASSAAPPLVFHATAVAPALLWLTAGDGQSGVAGAGLPTPLQLRVTDAQGSPLAGRPLSFTVSAGGGTLWEASTETDAGGHASAVLILGPDAGPGLVTVTGPGLSPILQLSAAGAPLPLSPAAQGAAHQQLLAIGAPLTVSYDSASGLPPGLTVDALGNLGGTPGTSGTYSVTLPRSGPRGFRDTPRATLTVLPTLSAYQRALILQHATRPMEVSGDCAAQLGTLARLDAPPAFLFAPEPTFAGTSRYSTQTGLLQGGGKTAGRQFLESTLAAVVPLLTGGRFAATFHETPPDTGTLIRVAPTLGIGASGDRLMSEPRITAGRVTDSHLYGNGRIQSGTLWLPEAWFVDAPPTTWDIDQRNDVLVHELGHVLNGPHTILPGPGFVQQRLRRDLRPLGPSGDPLHTLDRDEALAYEVSYALPVGTALSDLVRLGLVRAEDASPAPELRGASLMVSGSGIWWEAPQAAIHPGSRIALFGGRFKGPFEDVYCYICPWTTPTVTVTTAAGPVAVPRIATTWVGDPDQRLELLLPADAVTGDVVVHTTHPFGCQRTSAPYRLVVVP